MRSSHAREFRTEVHCPEIIMRSNGPTEFGRVKLGVGGDGDDVAEFADVTTLT